MEMDWGRGEARLIEGRSQTLGLQIVPFMFPYLVLTASRPLALVGTG